MQLAPALNLTAAPRIAEVKPAMLALGVGLGFLLTFDAVLPVGANARTTDLLNMGCGFWLLLDVLRHKRPHPALPLLAFIGLLSLVWVAVEIFFADETSDPAIQVVCARWLLGTLTAYRLSVLMRHGAMRLAICLGLLCGCLMALATVVHDFWTFDLTRTMPTLGLEDVAFIYGQYRPSGMFSHPNEAAGAILVAVPLCIGLVEERRLQPIMLLAAAGLTGTVFWLTESRAPTVIAVLLLILAAVRWSVKGFTLVAAATVALACMVGVGTMSDGADGVDIVRRLSDYQNIQDGAGDRLNTTLASLDIVLGHPFGVGSRYEVLLDQQTGFMATHNAFLQLALMGGLPLTLLTMGLLTVRASGLWRPQRAYRVEAWTSLYFMMVFWIENYFFVSFIPILTMWLYHRPGTAGRAGPQAIHQ